MVGNFSHSPAAWLEARFLGIVSGLAIQYDEAYSERERRWTSAAYNRALVEAHLLLQPGGRFVFSVNVPEPALGRVALPSL